MQKHNDTKHKIKTKVREEQKDMIDEISKMIFHGQILMEEKAHLIHGIKDELKKTSEHYNKLTEMQDMGRREAELQYRMILNEKKNEYKQASKNVKEQYEHLIKAKDEELQKFMNDANKYTQEKK